MLAGRWRRFQMIICRRAARKHVQLFHVEVLLVFVLLVAVLFHLHELMMLLDANRFGHALLVLMEVVLMVVVLLLLLSLVVLLLEHHLAIIWNHCGELSR